MSAHILVTEDDAAIRDMISLVLQREGYIVHTAASIEQSREQLLQQQIHLLILDWMLPGASGLEFVRSLRKEPVYANLPIIMLTAKTQEHDIISGLDAGADDYITKPFSPRELNSRIKALLRRSADFQTEEQLIRGPLRLNLAAHRAFVGDQAMNLGHTEFKLLAFLMQNPDRVYSRTQLLDQVWGPGTFIEERTVDVHILRLRKNLKPFGADHLLETVRGAGYKLAAN